MKIVLCVHGFPPELTGGTEVSSQRLALGLAHAGHQVLVIAGSCEGALPGVLAIRESQVEVAGAGELRVQRWTRPDLYFDHWHKSKSARVGKAFRELLRREQPDLVHVMHWLRLTRDLVQIAAQEGVRSVISLGDSFVSCPLTFRVKPPNGELCEDPLSAMGCIRCAGQVSPKTPWVPMEAAFLEFGMRAATLATELRLASVCLVPGEEFGQRQLRGLVSQGIEFEYQVQAPCGIPDDWSVGHQVPELEPLRIGAWGVLSPMKGTDLLFEALAGLDEPSQVELLLAGVEHQPGYLDSLRARFPSVRVSYGGPYQVHELPKREVTSVHLMVSASRAPESFGLVLDEARALGLPSLLPEQGAFAERSGLEHGSLFFEACNSDSLRACIEQLIEQPNILQQLNKNLSGPTKETQVLEDHLAIYERVLRADSKPDVPEHEWYAERMAIFAEEQWDQSLSACSAQQLGLEDTPKQ